MQSCPNQAGCPLYPLLTSRSLLRIWQINYCESDFNRCARYDLMSKGAQVPVLLLPNGKLMEQEKKTGTKR